MQSLSLLIPKFIRITHISDSHEIVNNWVVLLRGFSGCFIEVALRFFFLSWWQNGEWDSIHQVVQLNGNKSETTADLPTDNNLPSEVSQIASILKQSPPPWSTLHHYCTDVRLNPHHLQAPPSHTYPPPSPTTHLVFMFKAWVTGISFRPAQSPLAQFGLASVTLLVIKSNLN